MKPQRNEPENPSEPGPNYVEMAIAFISLVPELLLHDPRTFGIRSVAPRGGGAVLAMWVFGLFFTYDNTTPLTILILVTVILAIVARFCAGRRERRGEMCHSFYNGRPWLVRVLPMSEERMKRTEPLLLVLIGWGLCYLNSPLGAFVITAGSCYGFRAVMGEIANRTRVLDFNDAMVEHTVAMQATKRMRRRR